MISAQNDHASICYQKERMGHWDTLAKKMGNQFNFGNYYHRRIEEVYRFWIPPNQKILEVGCGRGDLLAALTPSNGTGIDFSRGMIEQARARYPHLHFIQADAHELDVDGPFDVIILSELLNDLWDAQKVLAKISKLCTPRTRLVLNIFSHAWEVPLGLARKLGLAKPLLKQNWFGVDDVINLFNLADFEMIHHNQEILWPVRTPGLDKFFNRFVVKLWPFNHAALTNLMVFRPMPQRKTGNLNVSVVVAARNEAGNIKSIIERIPEMGDGDEIIFVEGHSRDDTYETISKAIENLQKSKYKLFRQTGMGKGDAVRLGFSKASGDILMILDADMTVPPEDLTKFYEAICSGRGEFINGVRLVYPMEGEAMRFFNLLGNKFFSLAFSWILGQPIKDTLCGTKVLWREDYGLISQNRSYFGEFDPFGDFDLLFGASKLNLKIAELPIRYRDRTYGSTNIDRWKHGWILLKMVVFASQKFKFT